METSMLAFASDLHDEGVGTVLDNVQNRAGVNGLTMAVAYHDARDVFPHNPVRKVRYLEGGALFFPPDVARYGDLQPRVSELARSPRISPATMSRQSSRSRSTSTASGTAIITNAISRNSGLSASICSGCASANIASRRPAVEESMLGWFTGWYATNWCVAFQAGAVRTPRS